MRRKNNESGEVHVRIDLPLSTRKSILSAAIDTANIIKMHDEILKMREKKKAVIGSIGDRVAGINNLFKHLGRELPALPYEGTNEDVKHPRSALKTEKREVYDDEVDKLKAELADIERKLGSL